MNEFNFAGKSSRELGLYITGAVHNSPERDIEVISVPGRNGDLIFDNKGFKNVNVTYEAYTRNNLPERAAKIRSWFLSHANNYYILRDTYYVNYFRKARFVSPLNIEQFLQKVGHMEISFSCKPYFFSDAGQDLVQIKNGATIFNPEKFESRPYLKIYGNGSGNIFFNNSTIILKEISGYVEIDTELGKAFKGLESKGDSVALSEFPIFQTGENIIQWDGGITKIELVPRWCTV